MPRHLWTRLPVLGWVCFFRKGKVVFKNNCHHVLESQKTLADDEEKEPLYRHSYAAGIGI